MKVLLRLYPKAWRDRYEEEVERMLDDSASGLRDAPDLMRGALDAHANPGPLGLPSDRIRGWFSLERSAALVAIVAGVAWLLPQVTLSVLTASGNQRDDLMGPLALMALPGMFAAGAMAGLLFRHVRGRLARTIAATAIALVGMGSIGMITMVVANAADLAVPLVPYESAGVMLAGTAAVLVGTLVGVVAMWGRAPVGRRSLVWLALACVLELVYLASVPDGGFWFALRSAMDAGICIAIGFAWVSVGRSALGVAARPGVDRVLQGELAAAA